MKTIANLINFNKALVNEAKNPNTDMNPGFKKAVLEAGPINRAGTPARKAENLTIAKMGNMNAVPFQNAAQINAAGMMGMQPTPTDPLGGMNQVVQGGIPGTLPGSGNVPGVNQVPPTNKLEGKEKVFQADAEKAKYEDSYGTQTSYKRKTPGQIVQADLTKGKGNTLPTFEVTVSNRNEDEPKASVKAMEVNQVSKERTEVQEEGNTDVKQRTARLGGSF